MRLLRDFLGDETDRRMLPPPTEIEAQLEDEAIALASFFITEDQIRRIAAIVGGRRRTPVGRSLSYVYVIGEPDSTLVKIGVSTDPDRRLERIRSEITNPRIAILWLAPGAFDLERTLHRRFVAFRTAGEWFDFRDNEPIEAIRRVVEMARDAGGAR